MHYRFFLHLSFSINPLTYCRRIVIKETWKNSKKTLVNKSSSICKIQIVKIDHARTKRAVNLAIGEMRKRTLDFKANSNVTFSFLQDYSK